MALSDAIAAWQCILATGKDSGGPLSAPGASMLLCRNLAEALLALAEVCTDLAAAERLERAGDDAGAGAKRAAAAATARKDVLPLLGMATMARHAQQFVARNLWPHVSPWIRLLDGSTVRRDEALAAAHRACGLKLSPAFAATVALGPMEVAE